MANSGGDVIVYGVCETLKVATERVDVGLIDEAVRAFASISHAEPCTFTRRQRAAY